MGRNKLNEINANTDNMIPQPEEKRFVPLRNEKVKIKFINESNGFIVDKHHPLFGGLSPNAKVELCVPRLRTGGLVDPLTKDEKEYFETELGLEEGALSVMRKNNNYWESTMGDFPNKVILTKEGLTLSLNDPYDYIRYKILWLNNDIVSRSMEELRSNRKPTQLFVMVNDKSEAREAARDADLALECYLKFNEFKDDFNTLRVIMKIHEGRRVSKETKIEQLRGLVNNLIKDNPSKAKKLLFDKYIIAKGLIEKYCEAGIVVNNRNLYFIKEDMSPMCFENEEPTFDKAAEFISSPEADEIKKKLDKQIK